MLKTERLTCRKVIRSSHSQEWITYPHTSVWAKVIKTWLQSVGNSAHLVILLSKQQSIFNKLGISCEWFEFCTKNQIQLVGLLFHLPLNETLTFFQETSMDEAGYYQISWHEVSLELYQDYLKQSVH